MIIIPIILLSAAVISALWLFNIIKDEREWNKLLENHDSYNELLYYYPDIINRDNENRNTSSLITAKPSSDVSKGLPYHTDCKTNF